MTITSAEANTLDNIQATTSELNILHNFGYCSEPSILTSEACIGGVCNGTRKQIGYSADAVATHATPDTSSLTEYDCSNPATSGSFKRSSDCTLSAEVAVSAELTIVGIPQNPDNWESRTLSFTHVNSDHYTVEGASGQDPTLRLCAGDSYTIERATSGHGLNIKSGAVDQLSAVVTSGSPQSWTPSAGSYQYYCVAHPSQMLGDIIVESCGIPTITAAASSRHFKLNGAGHKLELWHVKLTGGDVNGKSSDPADIERRGGSIINYENNGEINLYYCEVSGNKAYKGGGIWTKGASSINKGIINIYNSIIKNNEATDSFGGMHLYHVVAKFEDTIIDNNKATYDGAGVYIFKGSTTIQNTVISNNNGGRDGGGLYIQSYMELFIRQSTFTNNTATNHGDEIFTTSDATITVVNTVVDTNGIHDASTPTWQTCANSPCSVAPFTAACSAADASDPKLGVVCEALHTEATCVSPLVWTPRIWTPGTTAELNLLNTSVGTTEASQAAVYGTEVRFATLATTEIDAGTMKSSTATVTSTASELNKAYALQYGFATSLDAFVGKSCSDASDCENACSHDSSCAGYSETKVVVQQLAVAYGHTCSLSSNGLVKCWGFADSGRLGYGDTENRGDQANEMGTQLGHC